jgi:PKD repeat protein
MRKGMTFEIGVGAFTICAVVLVFGLLTSTFKFPPRTGKAVGSLVVESNVTPMLTTMATPTPSPTPATQGPAELPLTAINPATPSASPTNRPPVGLPSGHAQASVSPSPEGDRPPAIVLAVAPKGGSVPLAVTVDASQSTDTDATPIANFVFDFGDGSPSVTPLSGGSRATHTYAFAGTYTLSVTAIDTGGHVSAAFVTITARFK